MTWWRFGVNDYGVCFNRDESRARSPSRPVSAAVGEGGMRYLCPRDPDGGGTWLMANEAGLIAGVLNYYEAAGMLPQGRCSRGSIPLACAECRSVDEAATTLNRLSWGDFAPCVLLVWDGNEEVSWTWNGTRLRFEPDPEPPVATSSYQTAKVLQWRRQRYHTMMDPPGPRQDSGPSLLPPERLLAYHYDATHPEGAFNVRMRRSDARTESICFLTVSGREVRFRHQREAPDALAALDEHEAVVPRA